MHSIARTMNAVSPTLLVLIVLVGCQAQPRPPTADSETREAGTEPIELAEGRVFEVDRQASEIRIVVLPAGTLARFGHPHVIGGAVVDGTVVLAEPFSESGFSLRIDTQALEVDRPDWRANEGFDPELSASAIEGTRDNMRSGSLLNVAEYPEILIESISLSGPTWQPDVEVRIQLRGQSRELTVPIALIIEVDQLTATGRFSLRQSDFGIEPFSAAGGSLSVADEILIRFRIVARQ